MKTVDEHKFPTRLKLYKYEIERIARRFGLNFRPIIYEMVDSEEMSEVVARHGFPVMPHHWRFGQESLRNKQTFKHGMGRVFEIVINMNPVYGFLLDTNEEYDQKAVMAHVCGHADLFLRNLYAHYINTDIDQVFAADAEMLDRLCKEFGTERVKECYDNALSLENLVDPESLYFTRPPLTISHDEREKMREKRKRVHRIEPREELPPYMDEFLNPPEWIEEQKKRGEEEETKEREVERGTKIPPYSMKDVLLFLIRFAPLESWQRAILEMARRHVYYFSQYRTKFMHEGWASLWEEEIMLELGTSQDKDLTRWTSTLAAVQRSRSLNPYKMLYEIDKDIEYRWNTGRHGAIWDRCDLFNIESRWDEFIVFHNLRLQNEGDQNRFQQSWKEFSAFSQALRKGELGFPEELFLREMFTSEILIPAWMRYSTCEKEFASWNERLNRITALGIEEKIPEEVKMLREESDDKSITDEELSFKARRDIYLAVGEEDAYLWTPQEIKREISALKPLLVFREKITSGISVNPLDIPEEWWNYSQRFPAIVELGKGKEKLFEVHEGYDDYNILDEFFTKDFCEKNKYFLVKAKTVWINWRNEEKHYVIESKSFERVKKRLLFQFTNFYQPIITVEDGNFNNNGELLLKHHHIGVDLDWWSKNGRYIKDVLERLFHWWGNRGVHIETIKTDKPEEKPWWFYWHQTEQKTTDEPETLTGTRVRFSWGPRKVHKVTYLGAYDADETDFYETVLEKGVKFKSPF